MKISEQFLALYKEYETLVKEVKGVDPKDYETKLDDSTMNRLRMCRYFRNYMSHQNDGGFIEVTPLQIKFLTSVVTELKNSTDTVKKAMKSATNSVCDIKESREDALTKAGKLKTDVLVVTDGNDFSIISVYALLSDNTKQLKDIKGKKDFYIAEPTELVDKIAKDWVIIVTADGTKNGKILGVIYPSMR